MSIEAHASSGVLDVQRAIPTRDHASVLQRLAEQGCPMGALVRRFAFVATGRGRLSFADFVKLRLFEPRYEDPALLRAFVGERRNLELCATVNYRTDWFGMLTDKVAESSYLRAYGLPTIPLQSIYMPNICGAGLLPDARAIEAFLVDEAQYPLFGKPVEGFQSLGSIALRSCDPVARLLEQADGTSLAIADFIETVVRNYATGYVFQPMVAPHPAIHALCRDRIATVRFLTLQTRDGPVIARAAMKIPAGDNTADNFWRPGNLLAQMDLDTGRLGRVVSGAGLDMVVVDSHPQTGALFGEFLHPDWSAMSALAIAGAHVMRHVPMIGWDIACTASGPVVVEMNVTPDMFLVQFADRAGMLDAGFLDALDYHKGRGKAYRCEAKASLRGL